jgi:hypothetical protein
MNKQDGVNLLGFTEKIVFKDQNGRFLDISAENKSSQVKLILSPKQRAKPKTSARKAGFSMPHCFARWVWLLRVLRSGGE